MIDYLPEDWRKVLAAELASEKFRKLAAFVADQRAKYTVYPPEAEVFTAFRLTPFAQVRVLLLGQDPYHGTGEAHGLCFSVKPGVPIPPSLRNIFKELANDIGGSIPSHGCLTSWAKQGMLMLNAVLTVRANEPASHARQGWEWFTDAVIQYVNAKPTPVVFVLWGAYAQKKATRIDASRHTILQAAHPSPLSANKGFLGSRCFSQINAALRRHGQPEIDWTIPVTVDSEFSTTVAEKP